MTKESPRVERMQCMVTREMRKIIEMRAAALDLSTSSYLELLIGAGLAGKQSKTYINAEEI